MQNTQESKFYIKFFKFIIHSGLFLTMTQMEAGASKDWYPNNLIL